MLHAQDHVDINVPLGLRSHGRIAEIKPPNCARVYVIPQKAYYLLKLEHLTLRECKGPRKHNKPIEVPDNPQKEIEW